MSAARMHASMPAVQARVVVRRSGQVALTGVVMFASAVLATHTLRGDLDWQRAPLSFYLLGETGAWLKAAYFMLAAGLVGVGIGGYLGLCRQARSAAPLVMFGMAAVALCMTAIADSRLPGRDPTLEGLVHGIAAQTAFLCVTTAMLLQSWRLRLDAAWRHLFMPALALAGAAFIALWGHALSSAMPRGFTQRAVVMLVLLWLAFVARALIRRERASRVTGRP